MTSTQTTEAPRPAPAAWRCINFRRYQKETLQGFATFGHASTGLVIHDCPVHQKGGKRWINFPARSYTKPDTAAPEWLPVVEIPAKGHREQFQREALLALNLYLMSPEYRRRRGAENQR